MDNQGKESHGLTLTRDCPPATLRYLGQLLKPGAMRVVWRCEPEAEFVALAHKTAVFDLDVQTPSGSTSGVP